MPATFRGLTGVISLTGNTPALTRVIQDMLAHLHMVMAASLSRDIVEYHLKGKVKWFDVRRKEPEKRAKPGYLEIRRLNNNYEIYCGHLYSANGQIIRKTSKVYKVFTVFVNIAKHVQFI